MENKSKVEQEEMQKIIEEYNQYYEDGMFPNQALEEFKPDLIYICTCVRNITDWPSITDDKDTVISKRETLVTKFTGLWKSLTVRYNCPIIQNNFEYPFFRLMGNKDASDYHGRVNFVTTLNCAFYDYAQSHENFYICDVNYISSSYGLDKWAEPFYWHMYKYAVAVPAIPYLSFNVANIIKSLYGKNKKAFNLDDSILHKDCITAFMRIAEITNSDISKFSDLLNKNSGSLDVSVSENKYFEISKMPVCNEKRTVSEIFVFYDVSTYYMLNKKLSEKNQELTKANTQLAKMNVIEKRLAVEKEQTRIAQELHDSVGHGLVSIMTLLKLSLIDKNNSNENTKKALQASELLLNDVRKCVVGIKTDTKSSISARIQDFICNYNSGNSCIEFTEMGEEKSYHGFASDTIFSVVREAVTNSIRHGNANKMEVILKFSENCIRLYIIDDGTGCDKIVPDFGLKGMKEKINSIGGNIEFSSLPDNGFSVKAYIPVEVINYD